MFETVIGLEIHVQLNTKSKVFCADDAAFGGAPNTHISAISLAHPGTLPRLNRQAIESAVRLGLALGLQVNLTSTFDRKNYFYADLPKGYQITQDRRPICIHPQSINQQVAAPTNTPSIPPSDHNNYNQTPSPQGEGRGGAPSDHNTHNQAPSPQGEGRGGARIHHIHLEEDAGKSIHDQDPTATLIDLNRAGVPLIEIVTEPDLRSAEQTAAFMEDIQRLVRWLDISDGNMEEGSLRCDVNISVRRMGATQYGQRCEIKNVNSMRFAKKAIEYEVARQIELIEAGKTVQQETRGFDPVAGTTFSLRDKEDAHDYRYFPEPDLPPVVITPARLEQIIAEMPMLPQQLFEAFQLIYGLNEYEATQLTQERAVAEYFMAMTDGAKAQDGQPPTVLSKQLANILINKIKPWAESQSCAVTTCPVPVATWIDLARMIVAGKVSNTVAFQRLFPALIEQPDATPEQLATELNLIQTSDTHFLEQIADEVLASMPDKVIEYKKGKKGLIGLFMGELMKAAKGKADPQVATKILQEKLSK